MSTVPSPAAGVQAAGPVTPPAEDTADGRSRHPVRGIAAVGAVALVALIAVLATRRAPTTRVAASPLVGKVAPEVAATALDGAAFDLRGLRGRWVLVNFFATWCVPCRQEHPALVAFSMRHAARGDAAIVGVVFNDDENEVRDFFAKKGGDWPMLADPQGRIAIDFGVAKVPESFLVDPWGLVVARVVGGVDLSSLEGLLAEAKRAQQHG